jgi:hypothetical protein
MAEEYKTVKLPDTDNTSLTCAARILAHECADANLEFMRCKQRDANPRACLVQGEKVTAAVLKTCVWREPPLLFSAYLIFGRIFLAGCARWRPTAARRTRRTSWRSRRAGTGLRRRERSRPRWRSAGDSTRATTRRLRRTRQPWVEPSVGGEDTCSCSWPLDQQKGSRSQRSLASSLPYWPSTTEETETEEGRGEEEITMQSSTNCAPLLSMPLATQNELEAASCI